MKKNGTAETQRNRFSHLRKVSCNRWFVARGILDAESIPAAIHTYCSHAAISRDRKASDSGARLVGRRYDPYRQ